MILDLSKFAAQRRPLWQEYEKLLNRLDSGETRRLDLPQIKRLRYLQDAVSSDLVKVRTYAADPGTTHYLEALVARGFGVIHENRTGARFRFNIAAFLALFAATVRKHYLLLVISTAAMSLGGLLGMGIMYFNPEAKEIVMPFSHLLGDPSERVAAEESGDDLAVSDQHASFSAYLMANNIRVSVLVLALGLIYGVFSVVLLFYNGVLLGAVVMDYILAGESVFLAGWLLPHGSVEIPCILFAGQAGLLLAKAVIVREGRLSLGARLKQQSQDIVVLIGGVAIILIWAAIIESFFSQYHEPYLPYAAKIGFGLLQLFGLGAFLMLAGRTKSDDNLA